MYKISVIIPIFNVEKYISKCLESVLHQTLNDIEIICIDDCGNDNSIQIAENYAKQDERIKIIHHHKNLGLSEARNTGIRNAQGEYLSFIDSDDYIQENFLEELYNVAQKQRADIAQATFKFYYENSKTFKDNVLNCDIVNFDTEKNSKLDVYYIAGMCWNKIYKTSLIKNNKIKFLKDLYWEDNPFVIKSAYYANRIEHTSNTNYIYRQHDASITQLNNYKLHFDILKTHKEMIDFINSINLSKDEYIQISCKFMNRLRNEFDKINQDKKLKSYQIEYLEKWRNLWKLLKYPEEIKNKSPKAYKIMSKRNILNYINKYLLGGK